MKIHYSLNDYGDAKIFFNCLQRFELPDGKTIDCRATGYVPKKIVDQGVKKIRKYTNRFVEKQIALQKDVWENIDKHILEINKKIEKPIKAKRNGINIEGKITIISSNFDIYLVLHKPFTAYDRFFLPWWIENRAEFFSNINKLLEEMIIMSHDSRNSKCRQQQSVAVLINKLNEKDEEL